ncbi:MAG: dTDP-4-dehydrorhamnose reductase [Myxococcota bacterium]
MTSGAARSAARRPLRIGVLGGSGQIGRCLLRAIAEAEDLALAFAPSRAELDLEALDRIEPWLDAARPVGGGAAADVVVNAAAFTRVDACEREVELAGRLNARMPTAWAQALVRRGVRFVHLSSDYVFSGEADRPYREEDATAPRSVYGESKRAGEVGVLGADPSARVVRTSWVFGPGRNFVAAILEQAWKRRMGEATDPIRVVDDQRGRPTAAGDLADALLALCRRGTDDARGFPALLHLANAGETTWYGFARAILAQSGFGDVAIEPVSTGAFPTAAPRPAWSVLDTRRAEALGIRMRPWTDALAGYLAGPDRPTRLAPDRGGRVSAHAGGTGSADGEPDRAPESDRRKASH